eukprot:TRINITY_DN5578_c0_g1_i1.p1 TRINITY_DN5578_c0_g1~~TRINITY_DN5578_c0_g1_i1.p1  ORF type:complete len:309 (-),score=87.68 TRINITY_DN5578_c0_g1_i1:140-1066(-)
MFPSIKRVENGIEIKDWRITINRSHILNSTGMEKFENDLNAELLPEMVFGENNFDFEYIPSGYSLQFNCFDSLKSWSDNDKQNCLKVFFSQNWSQDRQKHINSLESKEFDWTFTTHYKGTVISEADNVHDIHIENPEENSDNNESSDDNNNNNENDNNNNDKDDENIELWKPIVTDEKINLEELKRIDIPILFSGEIFLFEDELADNGSAIATVKTRIMPNFFFCLQRFFLRVDEVLFRVIDVRVYHEFDKNYILREYQFREASYQQLIDAETLPEDKSEYTNQALIKRILPIKKTKTEKIYFKSNDQ